MKKIMYAVVASGNDQHKIHEALKNFPGLFNRPLLYKTKNKVTLVFSDFELAGQANKELLLDYAAVIENLHTRFTILPFRFGTMVATADDAGRLLDENLEKFGQSLARLENKEEYGLKVFWQDELFRAEVVAKAAQTGGEENNNATGKPAYSPYIQKKLSEHRKEEALQDFANVLINNIMNELEQLKPEYKADKLTKKNMLLDAVVLLERNKQDDIKAAIGAVQQKYKKLKFMLTGPWPPYGFTK